MRAYEYVYRDGEGKQRWVSGFSTLKDAEDARNEKVRRLRRGERVQPIKATFAEFSREWLCAQSQLRPSTRARYQWALDKHLIPAFGRFKLAEIREDQIAGLIADMTREGYAGSTIKAVIAPLSLILGRAVRRGAVASNPVAGLERSERPSSKRRDMRILDRDDIGKLIDGTAPDHRPLITTLIFCGLRISEALGLTWADVDFDAGTLRVDRQLDDQTRERVEPKTPNAIRSVVLAPFMVKVLAEHRLFSKFSTDSDPVFATAVGSFGNRHNVASRIFRPAVRKAGLDQEGRPTLRLHDLRHTCASLLIAGGASVVFVSRQLGHGTPAMTLTTYSHLFDGRDHGDKMAAMLEAGFGNAVETATRREAQSDAVAESGKVASLRAV
jgi:integrase